MDMTTNDLAVPAAPGPAFEGGFYAGRIRIDDALFALVLSPAAGEIKPMLWAPARRKVDGARSYCDGHANTHELAQAGSKLAEAALGLTIGGFTDWYIPARDELELVFRHFKPGNATYNKWRSGDNPSSVPPGYPYTTDLVQTSVENFRAGAADALASEWYWSSTLSAPDAADAWAQTFHDGRQGSYHHRNELRARAVRRVAIRQFTPSSISSEFPMSDVVTLSVAGAAVTIPAMTLTEMWLERVRAAALPPAASTTVPGLPAIGSLWSGGVYAGIVRGDAGQRDYYLIVNTAEAEMLPWEGAKAWAANLEHDGSQWSLPKRKEQAVLYGNVPELFAKEWYWSGEEYAPDAAYAWAQTFRAGRQDHCPHNCEFRARAVLHIPVGEDGR